MSKRNVQPWSWPVSPSDQRAYRFGLRPSKQRMTENRSALHKIVYVCHQKSGLAIDRVTTGGSVGKWTASKHGADLDLVVFVKDLDPNTMKHRFPAMLDRIQIAVDQQYPGTRDLDWYRKFGLRYHIAGMEIDILIGATYVQPRDFLSVSNPEQRQYMSASVSHKSRNFIREQSSIFHDFVRVAKHWRDSFKWDPNSKPKSYLLELLMLEAFRRCKFCTRQGRVIQARTRYAVRSSTRIMRKFFELISLGISHYGPAKYDEDNLPPLFVYFERHYERDDIPLVHAKPLFKLNRKVGRGRNARIKTRKASAIVLDPVNPTNNLWLTLANPRPLVARARKEAEKLEN